MDPNTPATEEEEYEEISVEITEDGLISLSGPEWQLELSPAEARDLAEALVELADEIENPEEDDEDEEDEQVEAAPA